jgi:hypothetical protein
MKAITTTYRGPTNTKGSRITATDLDGNHVTVSYRHEHDSDQNHLRAAKALSEKMGWHGVLQGGHLTGGQMVWAWVNESSQCTV